MKTSFKFLAIVAFVGLFLQSCSSDDDGDVELNAPVISEFEFGEGHHDDAEDHDHDDETEEAYAFKGSDIHLAAEISAAATVSSITLSIHSDEVTAGEGEVDWEFEKVYTDAKYLVLNPEFHEHVDVPSDIPSGEYHIELLVTDEAGNSTEVEGHLQIMDPVSISGFEMDETVAKGNDFHIEFMIDAPNGIHEVLVDIHAHDLELGEGEAEWDYEGDFSEKFHELTEAEFHEHIDVPATAPAGEYHIIFTVEDEDGNTTEYETHIDVTA
ncbi:protein of unknown function [Zobellia uliginosa]|uniref:DUF4625 domain-containing protein n=1 Tax=Zobellia uliginosa TaxID=143224 RepID=A0ABY1KL73_9FLAO|nr:DUF4625 domain-containing protein [Zobellia uliginosa]SIS46974.1 protein of unknown function [Zobellia uliginosa]